ncbi:MULTISPECIES: DUF1302 family protein [Pasteurellaceae]|uniref:Porin n=1 Tax=Pasteurella atlantica TaxID=2827233 RepID=A0AAW8CKC9_9PAST|nr:DUF1302 family protein [Pasteurella atlantica]MBR0573211.1 hypothetical protein [Pasteurella atlantica]MDP8039173.1 hypothetical protein [Pasteurella atlantica]MDP8041228.1 hypothetical protein [Pasteurella atlantica]MDP8043365.1 hypothetical protein [Pasteurella atlantica]MDP8045451.1 hypothetical protein [Pasteurella atlantica]
MKKTYWALLLSSLLSVSSTVIAQDVGGLNTTDIEKELEEWNDDDTSKSNWNMGAFIEADYGVFTHNHTANNRDKSLAEIRSEIFANRYFGSHFLSAKLDLIADDIDDHSLQADLKELFVDFKLNDKMSVRLGQQVLTWGTGDYIFINDLFSKDWQSMLSGRDDSYLKKSDPAVKFNWFNDFANINLAWIPVFNGDEYISGERFSYYNPMLGKVTNQRVKTENPKNTLSNSALALRLSKRFNGVEYALYGYHGLYSQPTAFNPITGKNKFPKINAFGASVRGSVMGGIANAEISHWNFLEEKTGDNPFIPNDQINFLVGYEHELVQNVTLSGQYLVQKMQNYEKAKQSAFNPDLLIDKWHQTLTLRLNWQAMQQKLNMSLFAFYSPDEKDFYIKPKISYRQNDHWFYEIGANLFGGKNKHTQWGQFKENSNIYTRLKYNF